MSGSPQSLQGQGSSGQGGTQIQRVGVPTQSTLDQNMLEFINDITPYTPKEIRDLFWGFANNLVGMGKLTPREAQAMILGARNIVDMAIMAIPPWEAANPILIIRYENFINIVKIQVRRATTTNTAMNERAHIATQGSITETRNQAPPPRKKFLGVF